MLFIFACIEQKYFRSRPLRRLSGIYRSIFFTFLNYKINKMPNHIQNRLTIVGENYDLIKSEISSEDRQIDFNQIISKPIELDIDQDSYLYPLSNQFSAKEPLLDIMKKLKARSSEETNKNFFQGLSNYLKYGHATWYSWCLENWGTKWNAYGQNDERNSDNVIYFQTAWSSPIPVIKALSEKYPNNEFKIEYADEDTGSNCGSIVFKNGVMIIKTIFENQSKAAYDMYFKLNPTDIKHYQLVGGAYEYIDTDD
jgi:hypothetical protein